MFRDKTNRPHPITKGEPILPALGTAPATTERCPPGGNVELVPPFDASWVLDTDFGPKLPLVPPAPPAREKGWRAAPILDKKAGSAFAVLKDASGLVMGYGLGEPG